MKQTKKIVPVFLTLLLTLLFFAVFSSDKTDILKDKHAKFLKEHPFNQTLKLSKEQRRLQSLPPNRYFEEKYLLEINPSTGVAVTEDLEKLRQQLLIEKNYQKNPGETGNNWVERGPNNIGGRTRMVQFDPNDVAKKRVFAGGVSGGLWANNDITDPTSEWYQENISENLSVTCMAFDPNNSKIMYVGTGESYARNKALGNGVWKTTDGGRTWKNVYRVATRVSQDRLNIFVNGIHLINDIIVRDKDGSSTTANDSEIFITIGADVFSSTPKITSAGTFDYGLYKSSNAGLSWAKIALNNAEGRSEAVNDLEIGSDNALWVSTIRNVFGDAGGTIYKSTNGTSFVKKHTVANARRTEIAVSKTDASKVYIASELTTTSSPVGLYLTTDGFTTTPTAITLPADADTGIPNNDFTRGQAWYDLMLEVDPTNDKIAYIGGIDLFRTSNSGATWTQISKWSNNNNLRDLSIPLLHADQHGFTFHPTNPDIAILGNDGGVFYATSLSTASTDASVISSRNNGYNTTQFYKGAIGQNTASTLLLAGAQDNGTVLKSNATAGINSFTEILGGDGAYCFIDKEEKYLIVSYQNGVTQGFNPTSSFSISNKVENGAFINPMELDDTLDILFINGGEDKDGKSDGVIRYSNLLQTTLKNDTIKHTGLTNITAMKVSPFTTKSTTLFAGTKLGKLFRIDNADNADIKKATITDISGASFLGSISSIELGKNEQEILVTFHNFGVNSVWFSVDGGTTWTSKEGDLPDIPVKCILMNPLENDEVIVGTQYGVWTTKNFKAVSPTWTTAQNGMNNVHIVSFDLRTADNTVLAATHGRGLFTGQFKSNSALSIDKNALSEVEIFSGNQEVKIANLPFGDSKIKIFDLSGRLILEREITKNNASVSASNLKVGSIYIVNIQTEKGLKNKKISFQ